MDNREKVAQTGLDPDSIVRVNFELQSASQLPNHSIDAVILPFARQPQSASSDGPEHVVGVQDTQNDDGTMRRRYLKFPRRIMESREAVVELYDNHEQLRKGVGGIAITGTIIVGTLFVRRFHRRER